MVSIASTSGPARARRPRRDKTVVWAMARVLIVAGIIALGVSAYVASRPVVNPNVQDCGAPVAFFLSQRENVIIHPGAPNAPADPREAADLEAQPHCRDRAATEMARAGLAFGAFVILTFLGIIVGLLDDRVALWRAPRFESYLRELPPEARVRHGLVARVRADDLAGADLPPVESTELGALLAGSVIAAVGLPFVATIEATRTAAESVRAGPLVLAVVIAFVAIVAAALARVAVDPSGQNLLAWCRACWASCWQAGLRPLVAWFGIDVHRLRRWAVRRDQASAAVGALLVGSAVAHVVLAAVAFVLWWTSARPVVDPRGPLLVLVAVVVLVVGNGVSRLPARWRAFAVHPSVRAVRGIAPLRLAVLGVATSAQLLLRAAALSASLVVFDGGAPFTWVLLVAIAAIAVGALSPFPDGAGVVEAVTVLGLVFIAGVSLPVAVCAALAWRLVTFWIPLLTGWWPARRMG